MKAEKKLYFLSRWNAKYPSPAKPCTRPLGA